jgi:hypothetical protein
MIDIKVFEKNQKIIAKAVLEMEQSSYKCEVDNPLADLEDEIQKCLWDLHDAKYDLRMAIRAYKEAIEMGEDY